MWRRALGVAVCSLYAASAGAGDDKEYLVKAAFMYNFVKFVEWPGALSVASNPNVQICVIGDNPFGEDVNKVFSKASGPALSLSIVEKKSGDMSMAACHVAFISRSEEGHLGALMQQLQNNPVLTVSDINGFATKGGIIGFIRQENKIKLEINTDSAAKAGLRIDAQLLEIALHVIRN